MSDDIKKLGLIGLTAIVFSSIVGGGIYNIPQNMAASAGLGAIIISWLLTCVGMIFLVYTFKILSDKRSDLNAGIYQYAQVGYGNFVGFLVAWGYWLCTATGNVAYAVMLNDSLGAFWPVFLKHGWETVVFGIGLIWVMYFVVAGGLKTASFLNVLITAIQMISLVLIIVILFIFFKLKMFSYDFWGQLTDLGSVGEQVRTTMLVTLWCFTGIEGAVMMSSRAKNAKDVGKAGIIGFLCAWLMYALVSVLSFGILHQPELSKLPDPSVAYVLKDCCGDWAYYFVIGAIIFSILGGWIAWTLVCAQVPNEAAKVKIFPSRFLKLNKKGMPGYGLVVSSIVMTVFMCLVVTSHKVYTAALDLTSLMVLPAYLFSGMFMWKCALKSNRQPPLIKIQSAHQRNFYKFIGIGATLFCSYIVISSNISLLIVTVLFYLPGVFFYVKARHEYFPHTVVFSEGEKWLLWILIALGITGIILLATGHAGL